MTRSELILALRAGPLLKMTGPIEHWLTTFNTGFWGLNEDYLGAWQNIDRGDVVLLHGSGAMYFSGPQPRTRGGVIGVGVIAGTSRKKTLEWLQEIQSGVNGWPLLVHFEEVWWFGDTTAVGDISFAERLALGEGQLRRDSEALARNVLTFTEMADSHCDISRQGSISGVSHTREVPGLGTVDCYAALADLIEPRLRSATRYVAPTAVSGPAVDASDVVALPLRSLQDIEDGVWRGHSDTRVLETSTPELLDSAEHVARTVTVEYDIELQERASASHRDTLAALARYLLQIGLEAKRTRLIDCFVATPQGTVLFEVKSIHNRNERSQTRKAIGQLLDYAYFGLPYEASGAGKPALAVVYSRCPSADTAAFLESLGMLVFWVDSSEIAGNAAGAIALAALQAAAAAPTTRRDTRGAR